MISKTIIVGYGNRDRADDGVAFEVIRELRRRLGAVELEEGDTGLDDLNGRNDSIFIPQLVPEIMETLAEYDRIIFVDAHVGGDMEDISYCRVYPRRSSSSFTHHMMPAAFLAFLKALYRSEPRAFLVSLRGYEFDFRRTLSCQTEELVRPVVDIIVNLMDR